MERAVTTSSTAEEAPKRCPLIDLVDEIASCRACSPNAILNGREAPAGSSLRVDSAFMLAKPARDIGVVADSEPPVRITSASPSCTARQAIPIEWPAEAHALDVVKQVPRRPWRIATWPLTAL